MNSFKLRKELSFIFHLYSDDLQYTIPGVIEYGKDIECYSQCIQPIIQCAQTVVFDTASSLLSICKEDSISSLMLTRLAYEDAKEHFQYVLNFLVDSTPEPQKDPDLCKQRKHLVDSGQLGQNWWIHHIDLPDGTIVADDKPSLSTETLVEHIVNCDIVSFLSLVGQSSQ